MALPARPVYGLVNIGTDAAVPLKNIEVRSSVQGFIANVEYLLTYHNDADEPIEASFTFPLDDKCAIYRFEAEIEGRLVIGEVQDKDQARETYDDAIAAGMSAFLMEESTETGDIFECLVGNLPPNEDAVVRFAYAVELDLCATGDIRFALPSVIKPRYVLDSGEPANAGDASTSSGSGPAAKRAKTLRPAAYTKYPDYSFLFQMTVSGNKPIKKIGSGSEEDTFRVLFVDKKHTKAKVDLMSQFEFNHDLQLLITYTEPFSPHVVMETGKPDAVGFMKEHVAMLNFYPDLSAQVAGVEKGEYIFVMDRSGPRFNKKMSSYQYRKSHCGDKTILRPSYLHNGISYTGSMSGANIINSRSALQEFLKILPKDAYFNIVSFGSGHSSLFEHRSLKNNPGNMSRAMSHAKNMQADMGGTELHSPLQAILQQDLIDGYPRQIFVLTDGCVFNTSDTINLVKRNANKARVFTFGVGSGASTSLVKGLARAGRGKYEFINDLKQLTEKVKQTLTCAMQPCVQDVKLSWQPKINHTLIPPVLPPIFNGERLIVFVLLEPDDESIKKYRVTLKGRILNKAFEHSLLLDLNTTASELAPIHRLAAKAWVKELTDEEDYRSLNKDKITLISTSSNVVSKYTSFVGVDKNRPEKVTGNMKKKVVPTPAPAAPRLCGGAPPDIPEAEAYASGEMNSLPPDVLFSFCNSMGVKPGTRTKADASTAQHTLPPSQPRKGPNTGDVAFVQKPNNLYYPFNLKEFLLSGKTQLTFTDGSLVDMKDTNYVVASLLCSGDTVRICDEAGCESTVMILEYYAECDMFVVANQNGDVTRVSAVGMLLEEALVEKMRTRRFTDKTSKTLCHYPWEQSGDSVALTTSDLAELREDGWISNNLVEFYLRYLWGEVLTPEQRAATHCFSPQILESLLQTSETKTRSGICRDAGVLMESCLHHIQGLELIHKKWLFVPVFEITHWYLILVKIDIKGTKMKCQFVIMDSYFKDPYTKETLVLGIVLRELAKSQGLEMQIDPRVENSLTPVQTNCNDCGVCMLQCVKQMFADDLKPAPSLTWFSTQDLMDTRRHMARLIMDHVQP